MSEHSVTIKLLFILDERGVKIQDSNMRITVSFLRSLAVNKECLTCGRRYLAATEEVNPGICGACLTTAWPSPAEEEELPLATTRSSQPLGQREGPNIPTPGSQRDPTVGGTQCPTPNSTSARAAAT